MAQVMKTYFASVISEIEQSDIYLTIKARLFETPKPNLNGVRVTAAFIDEIVDNESKYIGLPLCADVKNLANGNYEHLGHLYDSRTGEFHSTQIGSFYKYEREEFESGAYLIGYARVMKRNKAVCKALAELFADGKLKFSFEISCSEYKKLPDDTIEIDASEGNFLEGAAIVTLPACEDAVALELVAEVEELYANDGKGDTDMADVNITTTESAVEETAEIVVRQEHYESDTVSVYDAETDTEVIQETTSRVRVIEVADENCGDAQIAESKKEDELVVDTADIEDAPAEDVSSQAEVETAACDKDKCAEGEEKPEKKKEDEVIPEDDESEDEESEEDENASCKKKIAELLTEIKNLKHEIAELKSAQETSTKRIEEIAEIKNDVNPFMASISVDDAKKKYSLLEPVEKRSHFSLLD